MSSRDNSDQLHDLRRMGKSSGDRSAADSRRAENRSLDIDPSDIDRYLSGTDRPAAREQSSASSRSTVSELDRLRRSLGQEPARRETRPAPRDARAYERPRSSRPAPPADQSLAEPWERSAAAARPFPTDQLDQVAPEDELWIEEPAPARNAPGQAVRRAMPRRAPQLQRPTLPRFIARAELVNDPASLVMVAVAVLGLALMAALVANRVVQLPATVATHVTASGVLDNIVSRESVWRLPLLAAILTLMDIGVAWFIMRLDRFAGRILLGGALLMQLITWVAVLRLVL